MSAETKTFSGRCTILLPPVDFDNLDAPPEGPPAAPEGEPEQGGEPPSAEDADEPPTD